MTARKAEEYLMKVLNTNTSKRKSETPSTQGKPRTSNGHSATATDFENSFQISGVNGNVVIHYHAPWPPPLQDILSEMDELDPPLTVQQKDQIEAILRKKESSKEEGADSEGN